MSKRREFDAYSASYEDLLRDPIRDRFSAGTGSQFFHTRKRDLILDFWRRRNQDTRSLSCLDLGCGKGDLLKLLQPCFGKVAGCDPSVEMMQAIDGIDGVEARTQADVSTLPFDDGQFDFVTAVCVYHHVSVAERVRLTLEVKRVLKPGGIFCIIEHNPQNPLTRLIVSRTPVDANAILLPCSQTLALLKDTGLSFVERSFFLYVPSFLYGGIGRGMERLLRRVPLGGQYAVFAQV